MYQVYTMHQLVLCLFIAITIGNCDIYPWDFWSPCGPVAGQVKQTPMLSFVARSRLDCAQICGKYFSCLSFTSCGTSLGYQCHLMDYMDPLLNCTDIDIIQQNCTFHAKKYESIPIWYTPSAKTSLSAECPTNSFLLPHYHVCYWLQSSEQNASDFQHYASCENEGGQLAIIPSESVMLSLEPLMEAQLSISSLMGVWVDIDDRDTEDVFVTSQGPAPWLRWRHDQPNDATDTDDQDCVTLFLNENFRLQDKSCTHEYKPLCYHNTIGDGYRHLFTRTLTSQFGDLSLIQNAAQNGNNFRIVIHSWQNDVDLAFTADYVESKNSAYTATSVHIVDVTDVANYVIVTASTTGELITSEWASGVAVNVSRQVWMSWYATDKQYQTVFKSTDPSELALQAAMLNGSDIRVVATQAYYTLHNLYPGSSIIGQFSWIPGLIDTTWTCEIPYIDGQLSTIDWTMESAGFTVKSVDYVLKAGEPWQLVYCNEANGNRLYGWMADLLRYANTGHRVKVIYEGRSAEADMIYTATSGRVSAMLTSEVNLNNVDFNTKTLTRFITMVSTTGSIRTYTITSSSAAFLTNDITNATVQWFVDASDWTEVHNPLSSNAYTETVNLYDVFYAGQAIRLRVELFPNVCSMVTWADSVEYNTTSGFFTAKFSRSFSLDFNKMAESFELSLLAIRNYFRVFSNGNVVNMAASLNGQSTVVSSYQEQLPVYWFAQPYIF